ncbi:retrovirus-related pol polyprotein from transposon TNT 1-94 [Tanacetum coccineum]
MFVSYQKVNELEPMFMGNGTSSKIEGKGKVILKLTSGKDLVLSNVLHVPNITKNLISGPILSDKGFKLVIESDKLVITKSGMYVGKGYLDEGLFKLSVVTDDKVINNNNAGTSTTSVYMIDPSFLWHSRLGHVNFRVPYSLWGEACLAANTILNKIPHKKSDKSPYQLWKAKNSVAYRFLVYKSNIEDISNNTIIESAKPDFFENIFPYKDKEKQILNPRKRVMNDQLSQDETYNNYEIPQENVEPRRSKRTKVTKDFGPDYMTHIVNEEPQTYKAVMESSEAPYWKEAIQSEIDSIMHNNTWKLVDLPSGHKPISHKWIFKKKLRPNGTIEKYKASLVAKGYRQKKGQDFFDTYSPVTRITSIRTLIAIAAIHNLIIHQMDVKTAFLNGELYEEIYMQKPEGFVVKGQEHKVCKLVKSLYGLKQAPKQWHEKFDNTLLSNGFQINECDKCVYVKQYKNAFVIICLYVDDMLIMGTNMDVINQTKKMLHSSFDMKDMGEADVILGIRIQKNYNGYILTQSHYIEKTVKKFGHYDDRPVVTPFDPKVQIKKNKGQNLAYSVSRLSRYSHNPGRDHWDALVRVLQYLKHTMAYGLHYTKYPPMLEGYCDANWISNHNEGRSTSGYVYILGGAAVSWKSSKQTVNTRSTMEAEFVALDKATEEAEWLRSFLEGIPLWPKLVTAVCIHYDSMAALTRGKNQIYKGKSRHIRRRHNTIKDLLRNGIISIDYVKSKENIVDPLTKGLCREQVIFTSRVEYYGIFLIGITYTILMCGRIFGN